MLYDIFHATVKFILKVLFTIFLRMDVKGEENVPMSGPVVLERECFATLFLWFGGNFDI